jgi:hypothetical protein
VTVGQTLKLIAVLTAAFVIFYLGVATPPPAPADAPAFAFSAVRAMPDIRAMGSTPHVLGSPANAHVRDISSPACARSGSRRACSARRRSEAAAGGCPAAP